MKTCIYGADKLRYRKHKEAQKTMYDIATNPSKYYVIHYSCESFYDITDGRTPRITSIAIKNCETAHIAADQSTKLNEN